MGSRVHTIGTVLSRTKELVKSGVIRSRPVWMDIVEAHPPLTPMAVNAACMPGRPPRINYRKDLLMKDFYERYKKIEETVNLFENHSEQTVAEKFVEYQLSLITDDQWITPELKQETTLLAREFVKKEYGIQLVLKSEVENKKEKERHEEEELNQILLSSCTSDEEDKEREETKLTDESRELHDLLRSYSNKL